MSQATAEGMARAIPQQIAVPGQNCWRSAHAARATFLIDASAYFAAFAQAVENARRSIFIMAWDIHSRTRPRPDRPPGRYPDELGPFLDALVRERRDLQVYILTWDCNIVYAFERGFASVEARRLHEAESLIPESAIFDPDGPIDPTDLITRALPTEAIQQSHWPLARLAIVLGLLVLLGGLWRWTPLQEWISPTRLTAWAHTVAAWPLAPLVMGAGIALGSLLMIPLPLFVLQAAFLFGPAIGFLTALTGALASAVGAFSSVVRWAATGSRGWRHLGSGDSVSGSPAAVYSPSWRSAFSQLRPSPWSTWCWVRPGSSCGTL
jgi:hypothetical protein